MTDGNGCVHVPTHHPLEDQSESCVPSSSHGIKLRGPFCRLPCSCPLDPDSPFPNP